MTNPDAPSWLAAAQAAAGGQQYPAGALYMVATPIGNRADLTLRALHLLAIADCVACEDTRHTAGLLRPLGLAPALLALHQHNEQAAADAVLARLAEGQRVACVSDAGTPGISDPGARLVQRVRDAGHRVVPIPGASALTALVSAAGLPDGPIAFHGFLESSGAAREAALREALAAPGSCVLFEAPHRIAGLAADLARLAGERSVTVGRELTKQFEQITTLPAATLPAWIAQSPDHARGEFVLAVHPIVAAPRADDALPAAATRTLATLLAAGLPVKQAAGIGAELTGLPRKRLYAEALRQRGDAADPAGES